MSLMIATGLAAAILAPGQASAVAPARPTGFAVTAAKATSLTVGWTNSAGATRYLLRYSTSSDGSDAESVTVGKVTTAVLDDLDPDTTYFVDIAAINAANEMSAATNRKTGLTKIATPKGLEVAGYSPTALVLGWDDQEGADKFRLGYGLKSDGTDARVLEVGDVSTATIRGLAANETYYVNIQALNASNKSAKSARVSGGTKLAPPTGLQLTSAADTSLTFGWTKSMAAKTYQLRYGPNADGSGATKKEVGDVDEATLTGLQPEQTYYVDVAALTSTFKSTFTTPRVTAVTGAPRAHVVAGDDDGVVNVSWPAMSTPNLAGYRLYWATSLEGPWARVPNTESLITPEWLEERGSAGVELHLETDTTYYFAVAAVDSLGNESARSVPVVFTTPPRIPHSLQTRPGVRKILVSWDPGEGSKAIGFRVYRATTADGPWTRLTSTPLSESEHEDTGLTNGTEYYYAVTSLDAVGNESKRSSADGSAPSKPSTSALSIVSVRPDGYVGDSGSRENAISGDGRYVAFRSQASDLVPGDDYPLQDIFVRDRETGQTELIGRGSGMPTDRGYSTQSPDISDDGRYVSFEIDYDRLQDESPETLLPNNQVYVWDRTSQSGHLVSHALVGGPVSAGGYTPSISGDGRYVTFASKAKDISPGFVSGAPATETDDGARTNVFVWDRQTDESRLVSKSPAGIGADRGVRQRSVISQDGDHVAFSSESRNLGSGGDDEDDRDVFVWDRAADAVTLVSTRSDGSADLDPNVSISGDGRFVTYEWEIHDDYQGSGPSDVALLWNRSTGNTRSIPSVPVSVGVYSPVISDDASTVVFSSVASNLVPGDTSGADLFAWDRASGSISVLTHKPNGAPSLWGGGGLPPYFCGFPNCPGPKLPSISSNGRWVAMNVVAGDLGLPDSLASWDVYVRDRGS